MQAAGVAQPQHPPPRTDWSGSPGHYTNVVSPPEQNLVEGLVDGEHLDGMPSARNTPQGSVTSMTKEELIRSITQWFPKKSQTACSE